MADELGEMNNINYLIQLEAYKRFKEEENRIRPLVEDKIKQYNEAKNEYLSLYSRYVEAITLSSCRDALQSEKLQVLQNIDQTDTSIETIARETNIDKQDDFLNTDVINLTKQIIDKAPSFEHLVELNCSTETNKNRVDFLQSSLMRVQCNLESSIVSGFDSLLKRIEN